MINKAKHMAKRRLHGRRAQIWVTDYTLSLLLFMAAAIIAVKIIINGFAVNTAFDEMKTDASKISEMLLSEGFPTGWADGNVTRPGLLNNESRLSLEKASIAMNLSQIPYNDMRSRLQTRYDFLVIFKKADGDMLEFNTLCTIGSPDADINNLTISPSEVDCLSPDFTSIDYDNLVKITRLAVYGANITQMEVYVWN